MQHEQGDEQKRRRGVSRGKAELVSGDNVAFEIRQRLRGSAALQAVFQYPVSAALQGEGQRAVPEKALTVDRKQRDQSADQHIAIAVRGA